MFWIFSFFWNFYRCEIIDGFFCWWVEERLEIFIVVNSSVFSENAFCRDLFDSMNLLASGMLFRPYRSFSPLSHWMIFNFVSIGDKFHEDSRVLLEEGYDVIPFVLIRLWWIFRMGAFKGWSQLGFLLDDLDVRIGLLNIYKAVSKCWALREEERAGSVVSMDNAVKIDSGLLLVFSWVLYLLKLN